MALPDCALRPGRAAPTLVGGPGGHPGRHPSRPI